MGLIATLASHLPTTLKWLRRLLRRPSTFRWQWVRAFTLSVLVTSAVLWLLSLIPAQWAGWALPGHSVVDVGAVAMLPGGAASASGRVVADGIDVFEPEGEILLTTVAIDEDLSVLEWIHARLSDSVELRSRWSVYGDNTVAEQRGHNLEMMQESKEKAVVVALEHLGVNAVDATGVAFSSTVTDSPTDGRLVTGEVIVAIDGEPVTTFDSLLELLDARPPGTPVVVTVEQHQTGETRDVEIVLGEHPEEDNSSGFVGIKGVVERIEYAPLPFDIKIASGSVGGPSAGLAFTLAVLDLLTPGDLTGGRRVAVTGSIRIDGSVGNVGGVVQKSAVARYSDADLFIVPTALVEQARLTSGDMPVVGVDSLDEALEALAAHGGEVSDLALPSLPQPDDSQDA